MAEYSFTIPFVPTRGKKKKKGRGRPAKSFDADSPAEEKEQEENPLRIFHFPGPTKKDKLQQLYDLWYGCQKCVIGEQRQLYRGGDIVFMSGNPDAHVLIVGEAPGEQEDEALVPFIGSSGQLLNMLLASVSDDPEIQQAWDSYHSGPRTKDAQKDFHDKVLDWRESEFALTNVISCRPPDNREPTLPEMKACWERLFNIIYIIDPLLIIACGNTALNAVTRKLSAQITKVRGQIYDVTYHGMFGEIHYPVMPILHPSYLGRIADFNKPDGMYMKTRRDIRVALRMVDFLRNRYWGTPIPRRGGA